MNNYSVDINWINRAAEFCHGVNKLWCEMNNDFSQPDWKDAPEWQKKSAIQGVEFHLNNQQADDAASHNNWLALKEADGWTYGTHKDTINKIHPCMVPFEQLPIKDQIKDALFRNNVHALLKECAIPEPSIGEM